MILVVHKKNLYMDFTSNYSVRIPLKTKTGIEFFSVSDIVCFYIENSKVKALFVDGNPIRIFHTLIELETSLAKLHFYRCHSASLINLTHIKRYTHKTCIVELTVEFNKLINSMLPPHTHTLENLYQLTKEIMNKLERFNMMITTITAELTAKTMELMSKTAELAFLQ